MNHRVSIIGVGATKQGEIPDRDPDLIAVDALRLAIADAGIKKTQIDGLITCPSSGGYGTDSRIGQMTGIGSSFTTSLQYGTANFSLHAATAAINAGLANVIAVVYGTNQRSTRKRFSAPPSSEQDLGEPYGLQNISGPSALAFQSHRARFGTSESHLGKIVVSQRQNATLNPLAIFQEALTLDEYLSQPYLVEPLRRPDVCMISDGGAAAILARSDLAKSLSSDAVSIAGIAQSAGPIPYQTDYFDRPWAKAMMEKCLAQADTTRADIDLLYIQDPTSVYVLQMLELLGFCDIGDAGDYIDAGHITIDGALPVNTNGGQLSEAYMWGWLHVVEAVRQLRATAGVRQVPGAAKAIFASARGFERAACTLMVRES